MSTKRAPKAVAPSAPAPRPRWLPVDGDVRLAAAVLRRAVLDAAGRAGPLENRAEGTWDARVAEIAAEAQDFLAADSPRLRAWARALDVDPAVLQTMIAQMRRDVAADPAPEARRGDNRDPWRRGEARRAQATLSA